MEINIIDDKAHLTVMPGAFAFPKFTECMTKTALPMTVLTQNFGAITTADSVKAYQDRAR